VTADCLKLTAYLGLRDRGNEGFAADALLDIFSRVRLEASILLLGSEGFGLKGHLRSDFHVDLAGTLPLVSIAIGTRERIEIAAETAMEVGRYPLLTIEPACMLTGKVEDVVLHETMKLSVYVSYHEKAFGQPAFMAACDLLYRRGLPGATVVRGVDGTVRGARMRARALSLNKEAPVMVTVIGAGEQIGTIIPELAGLLRRPLFTLERVRVCKREGELLARPCSLRSKETEGVKTWQKLMIYGSEVARDRSSQIHSPLIRLLSKHRLTAGATSLRGIWGFHGDRVPHGDRALQLRRHVPMVTTVVDTPESIGSAFDVVDEVTTDRGLVINEMVTAL
jgi:PII-like signaling protein